MNNNWFPRFAARMFGTLAAVGLAWSGLGNANTHAQQFGGPSSSNTMMHDGQAFRVVQASDPAAGGWDLGAMQSAMNASSSSFGNEVAQVGHHGLGQAQSCGSCGTQCGGACGSAGFGGGMACPTCDPYRYASVEALFMRREGIDNFTVARDFALDDLDFEWAPRITVGVVPDCVNGFEVGFTGVLDWESDVSVAAVDGLSTLLIEDPLQPGTLGTFGFDAADEADAQRQIYESRFWSVEMNRTMMAWDVAKLLIGGRYIDFEEDFNYSTVNGANTGLLRNNAANRMIGLQVGADIYNPIGRFSSSYVRARAGGFLNIAESSVLVRNETDILANGAEESTELSGMFEFGTGVRYQVGELMAVRGGFEAWYLTGVATSEEQISSATVTPTFGRSLIADDDVFFIGLTFGAELKY
ncbi:MAG: hypothetical protein CMM00_05810 [Rhodopirellula sp.]|jgi:hypothetical protein|uniref:Signal peptide protein n=2 Tax=Pirellulaceae TaxID=2691357 RepID=M5S376_9BACT|nr:hypothetical protein [Rhodopirellula europaea]EMI26078.1 signal peptide protein [Rhodopirellula europaea SH398]MAP08349.1 hypothetical protein [Rhodopirellula sp.]